MSAGTIIDKLTEKVTTRCIVVGLLQVIIVMVLWSAARTLDMDSAVVLLPARWGTLLGVAAIAWVAFALTNRLYHWLREQADTRSAQVAGRKDSNNWLRKHGFWVVDDDMGQLSQVTPRKEEGPVTPARDGAPS